MELHGRLAPLELLRLGATDLFLDPTRVWMVGSQAIESAPVTFDQQRIGFVHATVVPHERPQLTQRHGDVGMAVTKSRDANGQRLPEQPHRLIVCSASAQ